MIERIIAFSIRHRLLVIGAGLALAVWGVYAAAHTPIDAIPNLSENQVIVFTDWRGHSPQEIEDQITYPLSVHLQGLAGVRAVRSSSDFNFSIVWVIFEDGEDYDSARAQVIQRLARTADLFPSGVQPYVAPDAVATGQIFWYTVEGPGSDLGRLRAVQDFYVRQQLASVPGVAEVASVGGYPIEYQVELDPLRLAGYGLTPQDVEQAIAGANGAVGGHVIQKANAEYIVQSAGWLGSAAEGESQRAEQVVADLEQVVLASPQGALRLSDVARVSVGAQFRRGVLEKDGSEAVGGVVMMRHGENALAVTRRILHKITELGAGLPAGVRIVPVYDRTPLIEGAVRTVAGTLVEAIVCATLCVVLVLLHFRTSLVIAVTLPLAALSSFAIMWSLRKLGIADIQTNIMSLAGIAISIGVLVDSSIVMAENAMHRLRQQFGDRPVRGDTRGVVLAACRTVGRPVFFSVLIMVISFLPVFALEGMEGKMFFPLACTKSFALASAAVLAITLVPALCTIFIKGRVRDERESWIVRGVIDVYRPVLAFLLERPAGLAWLMGATLIVGFAPLGNRTLFLGCLLCALGAVTLLAKGGLGRAVGAASLILVALIADQQIEPLPRDGMQPLDEGMVMDMPITTPRAGITQSGDDLKTRDMLLCRFPEVEMVVGKAGRADSPADPAPLDMIESMVGFYPRELWPRRKLRPADAREVAVELLDRLSGAGLLEEVADPQAAMTLAEEASEAALVGFDATMREVAYQKNQELIRGLGRQLAAFAIQSLADELADEGRVSRTLSPAEADRLAADAPPERRQALATSLAEADAAWIAGYAARKFIELELAGKDADLLHRQPSLPRKIADATARWLGREANTTVNELQRKLLAERLRRWRDHTGEVNEELLQRGPVAYVRLVLRELLARGNVLDERTRSRLSEWQQLATKAAGRPSGGHHAGGAGPPPMLDPIPKLDELERQAVDRFARQILLWPCQRTDFDFGGEMDRVLQMPGWANVWTSPIQNRVDMLATGVNTDVGIRVLGSNLDDVVRASEQIGEVVRSMPGAADVVVDAIRGKGYLEIQIDRPRAAQHGVRVADIQAVIGAALGGVVATTTVEGRERHPVRVRYARIWREDEESVRNLLVRAYPPAVPGATPGAAGSLSPDGALAAATVEFVPLDLVADVRIADGPATIKSENGLLRNYVRLNVKGRDSQEFVDEAKRRVERMALPAGVHVEYTGQFEHQAQASRTLSLVVPLVVGLIFLILYLTYHDLADAILMVLAVPGALAGGVFFQWLFGYPFSVTVWVGYIACFGMATATGIVMLVYLREAVERRGGLEQMTLAELKAAVMEGAVHRLRPKLLTEATTILGLAPMFWATGPGAEVIQPMAAPVLGGILIADEVIDLFLPVLFYWVRRGRWERIHHGLTRRAQWRRFGTRLLGGDAPPVEPKPLTPIPVAVRARSA